MIERSDQPSNGGNLKAFAPLQAKKKGATKKWPQICFGSRLRDIATR